MCGEPRSKHALIEKRPEIKLKRLVFLIKVMSDIKT